MIVSIPYDFRHGGEVSGLNTIVYIHPASGFVVIDVLLNGVSLDLGTEVTVDNTYGKLTFPQVLGQGDHVLCVFKQLPRYGPAYELPDMVDFDPADFDSVDFA